MILQVVNKGYVIECDWVKDSSGCEGSNDRYYHPVCVIWFKGKRSVQTDHMVMLALQDCNMPVRALRYNK